MTVHSSDVRPGAGTAGDFAAKVRAARAVLGWNQTELGKRTALTQRAIYRLESGITRPRPRTMQALLEAFRSAGIQFEELPDAGFKLVVSPVALRRSRGMLENVPRSIGAVGAVQNSLS